MFNQIMRAVWRESRRARENSDWRARQARPRSSPSSNSPTMAPPPADYALYYVTGRALLPPGKDYYESLEEACQGGVTLVQVREKSISTRAFLEIATKSKAVCDKVSYLRRDLSLGVELTRPCSTTSPS